jgi:hypothetical protein
LILPGEKATDLTLLTRANNASRAIDNPDHHHPWAFPHVPENGLDGFLFAMFHRIRNGPLGQVRNKVRFVLGRSEEGLPLPARGQDGEHQDHQEQDRADSQDHLEP